MSKKFNGLDPFKQIIKDQKISKQRLAEMWCELNRWVIPKEFESEILQHDFDDSTKGSIAMKDILSFISLEKCLKQWNKEVDASNE